MEEYIAYQCTLSRSAYTGYYGHHIEWETDIDTFQIVFAGTLHFDVIVPWTMSRGELYLFFAKQIVLKTVSNEMLIGEVKDNQLILEFKDNNDGTQISDEIIELLYNYIVV